jgi:hypothetical protein
MSPFQIHGFSSFGDFPDHPANLGLMEREPPAGADAFFARMMETPFKAACVVSGTNPRPALERLVAQVTDAPLRSDPVCEAWTDDMAEVCRAVRAMLGTDSVRVRLDSHRRCRRYHADSISIRTAVTYAGIGTEYIPDTAADRDAYRDGASNADIVTDPSAVRVTKAWDVALLRGGRGGILHRTPDAALGQASVFMRIDPPETG